MYKKNLKRNFLLVSISVLSIGILSGCSNQVNYMGSDFEEFISEQVKTSGIMSSQLSDALNGNFYEDLDNGSANLKDVYASLREPNQREMPFSVKTDKKCPFVLSVGSLIDISEEEYLSDSYKLYRYMGEGKSAGAYIYELSFTGTKTDIFNKYLNYIAKIENEFAETYGDSKYINTTLTTINNLTESNKYIAIYDLEGYYLVSYGHYSEHKENITHKLAFLRKDMTHNFDCDYKDALIPFDRMVDDRNIPNDFRIRISYTNKTSNNTVTSDDILADYNNNLMVEEVPEDNDIPIITDTPSEPEISVEGEDVIPDENVVSEEIENTENPDDVAENSDDAIIILP